MLTKKFFKGILFGLTALSQLGYALDTDVYKETTVESSPRILLLIDTSGSMRCASDPDDTDWDKEKCSDMRQAGGVEVDTGSGGVVDSGVFKVDTPHLSRMDVIKRILNDFIAEDGASPWPDTYQVGLSVMSRPGAAIIQPVKSLDSEVTDESGSSTILDDGITRALTNRDLLAREIDALSGSGTTPTMGAIFEAGMYMAGLPVVTGVSRKFVDEDDGKLDQQNFDDDAAANWYRVHNKRISSPSTFTGGEISPARNVSGTKSACQQAMDTYKPEFGRFTDGCADEVINETSNLIYTKPQPSPIACADGGDHVVLITDGFPTFNSMADKVRDGTKLGVWAKRFINENMSATGFHASCPQTAKNSNNEAWQCMKKIAQKMKNKYNITLHIISFLADSSTVENLSDNNLNLKAMAEDNGGSFFLAQSMSDVKLAIESIATSTISAVTYSSPGVAVDNFNMFQHENFVHHSLFRPGGERFWYGNMKRYKLGEVAGVNQLLDKNDSPVVDLATGLFKEGTRDYWSNEVDGANVLKGGITTTMSKGNNITLFTDFALGTDACNQAFGNGDALINAANCAEQIENYIETDAMQGVNQNDPTAVAIAQDYADRRYKWIFGFDHKGQEWDFMQSFLPADQLPSEPATSNGDRIRKWLGAAIHSSPVVVNYTTQSSVASEAYDSDTESNAIFLGTNDGHFYAFNPSTGDELFRFLPEPMFKKVRDFSSHAKGEIVHGMDGNWTVWREDEKDGNGFRDGIITVADGDHVYAYGGMRRGGDYYYGLDLSNLSTPKLLFKVHGAADGATATYGEYARLGETWSQPELVNVKINGASTVLLVFGGGHDTAYDPPKAGQSLVNDPTTSANALGNAIYLVYAEGSNAGRVAAWVSADASGANGTTHADMKHSIVSRLSTLDLNADGYVDHIYAGDLGGQVFRIDIDNTNTGTASLVERARTLGKFGVSGSESNLTLANRRFYDPLSIAYVQDQMINKSYIAVAAASGWREHPFETAVDNRLYVIRDDEPLKSNAGQSISTTVYPITHTHLTTSMIDLDTLAAGDTEVEVSANLAKLTSAVVVTKALSQSGEKAFGSPSIANNTIFFSSLVPPADINDVSLVDNTACTRSTGKARTYGLSLLNGAGMLPNPTQTDDSDTVDTVEFIEFDSAVAAGHISVHLDADGGGTVSSGHTSVADMPPPSERAERMYWKQSSKGKQVNWEAYYGSSSTQTEEEPGGDDQGGGDGQDGDGQDDDDDDDDD